MHPGVDPRQAAAACPLWLPTLQLLVATLRLSANRRHRGFMGCVLTEFELSRIAGCVSDVCSGGDRLAAAAPDEATSFGEPKLPEWQALLCEARRLSVFADG